MAFIVYLLTALWLAQLCTGDTECRAVNGVIDSAKDLATNVKDGGHIWQHIYGIGQKPVGFDAKDTQSGKSLFKNEQAFDTTWANMLKLGGNFVTCPDKGGKGNDRFKRDTILAKDLGVAEVFLCTAIDANKLCTTTQTKSMVGKNIVFDYMWKGGKWILRTAWPDLFGITRNLAHIAKLRSTLLRSILTDRLAELRKQRGRIQVY